MHDRYCSQHISQCIKCKLQILNDDMDDHLENCGITVICQFCSLSLLKIELNSHLVVCQKKPKNCGFCTVQLDYDDIQHEINCGSRTELCPDCEETVLVKDFENHINNSCTKEKKISEFISIEKYVALQKKNKIIPYQNQKGSISILNDLGLLYNSRKSETFTPCIDVKQQTNQQVIKQTNLNNDNLKIIPKENDQILQKKLEKLKKKMNQDTGNKMISKESKSKKYLKPNSCNFDDFQFIIKYETSSLEGSKNEVASSGKKDEYKVAQTDYRKSNLTTNLRNGIVTSKYNDYYFD